MKRAILGFLAAASVAILFSILVGVFDLDGATRLLVFAGAAVVLITAIDGLRPTSTPETTATETTAPGTTSAGTPAPPSPPVPPRSTPPTPLAVAASAPTATAAATTSDDFVIDLRDTGPETAGLEVVEQLIADGELSRTGPISDDDVGRIVMAALVG